DVLPRGRDHVHDPRTCCRGGRRRPRALPRPVAAVAFRVLDLPRQLNFLLLSAGAGLCTEKSAERGNGAPRLMLLSGWVWRPAPLDAASAPRFLLLSHGSLARRLARALLAVINGRRLR